MYEVELKFPLPDATRVLSLLRNWGAAPGEVISQSDEYFNHPSRDFAETDEAFRLRRVGVQNFTTYKGPVLDAQTKTRREIEIRLEDGPQPAADFVELVKSLSFRPVAIVTKQRTPYRLSIDGRDYEIVFDDVEQLGTFLEIETLAGESERNAARDGILALAARLGLSSPERRSYLRLLLESRSPGTHQS